MIALVGLNANAAMYLVGSAPFGQGWDPSTGVEMTDNGDGTYTYTATVSGAVYFCFADGLDSNWDVFNGQYRFGPTGGTDQVVEPGMWITTQRQGNGNGSYKFTGTGGEYTVTFDLNNMQFNVEGYVAPITEDVYTVAGSNTDLFGTSWDPSNADNDMTLVDGLYTWAKANVTLPAGSFSFKVAANHSWDIAYPSNDYYQAVPVKGIYDVTITFDAETKDVVCNLTLIEEIPDTETHTYTVAGVPAALFGTEWDNTNEANDMTLKDGVYTLTKSAVALTAGDIAFKVVQDHNWDIAYPADNYVYTVEQNGDYDVTITFNETTKEVGITVVPVEVIEDFYTVAGEPAAIFGEEWNPSYAANNMVLGENGLYTWSKNDVEMAAGQVIEFKVVKNANWTTCYPENNWHYECPADGTYDLIITFNPENNEVTFAATKQEVPVVRGDVDGDTNVSIADVTALIDILLTGQTAPASADCDLNGEVGISDVTTLIDYLLTGNWPAVEMVYTVVGDESVFGSSWNPADEANDMVKQNGIYTWTKEGVTLYGNFEFKVVGNHDWSVYEWPIGMNNWVANLTEGEGIYTIAITFDPEADDADRITCTLTKTGEVAPVEHVYTVAGTENLFGSNWNPADEANDMVKGQDGIYTWTKEGVEFTDYATIEFKVVQDHAWTYAWPSSNWWAEITEAGTYNFVITFDPSADDANKITYSATKQ